MSYFQNLEEIPDEDLRAELLRRDKLRRKNLCAYCKRPRGSTPACKIETEHTPYVAPAQAEKEKARVETLQRAKETVHEKLCRAYRVEGDGNLMVFLWYIVEGAAVYWADKPSDFGLQSADPDKAIVFGGWNRITYTPAGGYQIQRNSSTDDFVGRYLTIGPNPAGWY